MAGTAAELLNRTPLAESLVSMVALVLGAIGVGLVLLILAQLWIVGARLRYLSRVFAGRPDAYAEAVRHLVLMPGNRWLVRLRAWLLRVPLPAGFE